ARGGMGVVYRATQLALDRPVALKVISAELAGERGFRERFLRESRLAAKLDHPAVVPVFDAREEDGELIVAMRLVEGGDLRKLIDREGPLEAARAIAFLGQIAEALDAAHAAGIVHRDVKPHNILIEGDRAYLSDFGLAKAYGGTGGGSSASVVGTIEYMAPEQWRGERVGPAADVYALGCVLYEALTGVVPFARREAGTEPEMPRGMEAVIERAVAKDPAERYRSAGELIDEAERRAGATPAPTRVLSGVRDRPTRLLGRSGGVGLSRWRRPIAGAFLAWFLAGLAFVTVATIGAILVLGDDGVSVSAPIRVAPGPLRLATGEGYVWATSASQGTLSRIDPDARTTLGTPLRIGRGVAGIAVGEGSVWVADPRHGDVIRIDAASERVLGRIDVGSRPVAVAFGGHRVWVADGDGAGITAINAAGGRIVKRGIAPHSTPLRLAVGAGGLWVSSATTGSIRRIDLGDATAGPAIPVGRGPSGVTVGHGYVWVANSRAGTVIRVDPSTHLIVGEPIELGGHPGGIDAGTDVVWVANATEDSVSRIGLASGEVEGDSIAVGADPGAVVVGEEAVWVANNGDGTVTRIEP
ncbi:MAG TPA: serine/threonine-protein kinase, partial [Solirubrobacterales bacterium]|nr:serine/threonine-protein kinase [Solirubrobacterales bacterium]